MRSIRIILIYLLLGPPVGGTIFWFETIAIELQHGREVVGAGLLPMLALMIAFSYPFGGAFALVAGVVHAVSLNWMNGPPVLVPVLSGVLLGGTAAAFVVWMQPASVFGDFWRQFGSSLPLLLPPSLIASLVCWKLSRRSANG